MCRKWNKLPNSLSMITWGGLLCKTVKLDIREGHVELTVINLSTICTFLLFWKIEVTPRTATEFLSLLLSCVALGSDTQGTHKEQNLFFVRHAREWKLESDVQKNRSIKPKIRWKAKKSPDVRQGQHQALKVQQALTEHILSATQKLKRCCCKIKSCLQQHLSFYEKRVILSFIEWCHCADTGRYRGARNTEGDVTQQWTLSSCRVFRRLRQSPV